MSSLTELKWPSQQGKAHPNIFTVSYQPTTTSQLGVRHSPLWSRQPWGLQKEHMWMKQQARQTARALKNALLLSSLQTCEYRRSWTPCLHKTRSVTISRYKHCNMVLFRLNISYQTSWNTEILAYLIVQNTTTANTQQVHLVLYYWIHWTIS